MARRRVVAVQPLAAAIAAAACVGDDPGAASGDVDGGDASPIVDGGIDVPPSTPTAPWMLLDAIGRRPSAYLGR